MNAYLFTAGITQTQLRPTNLGRGQSAETLHTWESCPSMVVCAETPDAAQEQFEAWLHHTPNGEKPIHTHIQKLLAAQFFDQLLTEAGQEPIDWTRISEHIAAIEAGESDDADPGYWADVNELVRPERISDSVEALLCELPEDIRSGLNWSPEKQHFFIVSVLSPTSSPAFHANETRADARLPDDFQDEASVEPAPLEPWQAALPELADKEVAVLVQARNSVVAAWLWRQFAVHTPLAAHDIDIDPWCAVIGMEAGHDASPAP